MTHITIEIQQGQDIESLLALLRKLNYRVIQMPDVVPGEVSGEETLLSDLPEEWEAIVKPIRQSQTIEDMIQEQNYKGFNRAVFDRIIDELDIKDTNGELLKLLRA